MLTTKHRTFWH